MFIGGFKKASASFLKKRSKKLLFTAGFDTGIAKAPRKQKFFCFFFFKKRSAYLFFSLGALPALAQTAVPVQKVVIEVSPLSHSRLSAKTFPQKFQRLTARDITAEGPASLTNALDKLGSGVNLVNSQSNPYQPTIIYHGFEISPIQGTPAGLSVYVDGARFNQPFGDIALWSVLPDDAIDSLSVEDGNPVFGLNALGGAIDVQLKNGFTYEGREAELSGGSFDQIQGNVQDGKEDGKTAAYVDLSASHEAGWRDLQSSDLQNFYGDLGWRGAAAELHVNATLANSTLNGPGTVPVQLLDADPSAQFTGPNGIADRYAKFSVSLNDQLTPDISLQTVAYYDNLLERLYNGNGPNDLPCGPGPEAGYLCQGGPGNPVSTTRGGAPIPNFLPIPNAAGIYSYAELALNTTNTNGYGASAQLTVTAAPVGLKNQLTAGISYDGGFTKYGAAAYDGGIDAARVYTTPAGIPNPGYIIDEPGTVPVGVVIRNAYYGAYATDTLNLTGRIALTAGVRFNIANIALHDQDPPDPNAQGAGLTGRHFYDHLNPAIGITYNLTRLVTLYGGVSEANAAPTPAELSCASPEDSCSLANFLSGDPNLKQIVTRSAEFGLRGAAAGPFGAILSYDADYYASATADDIEFLQSPYDPIGSGYFSNVGDVERNGFDLGAHLDGPNWRLYANYSRINATYGSSFIEQSNSPAADANGNITVNKGDHLPGIPQNLFKFGGSYDVTPRWTIALAATAQTSTYLYGDEANLTLPLPGYLVADITSTYHFSPRVTAFVTIDNVTDARYYNYGTFSPIGGVYVAQAPDYNNPRSYSIAAPIGAVAGVKMGF
jgi:outer membrane receptor protein involved in Fe transport